MNAVIKAQKLQLLSMSCFLRRKVRKPGAWNWLFERAVINAGQNCFVPGVSAYRGRAHKEDELTRSYVTMLAMSLEQVENPTVRSILQIVAGQYIHEEILKRMKRCCVDLPPEQCYPTDVVQIAMACYKDRDVSDFPYLRDALEDYGFMTEVEHFDFSVPGVHQLGCPFFLNICGRYYK